MTTGITTWDELGRLDGGVLAIVTSPDGDRGAVDALLDELARHVDAPAIHVIAGPAWRACLSDRGLSGDRALFTMDDHGRAIELNHFLETPAVVRWAVSRRFGTIVGSAAHGLHNEEVKDIFEQRVCLLLGDGGFLAHTLPGPYVFRFDLPGLLHRLNRGPKLEAYTAASRALMDDLYRIWQRAGAPATCDDPGFSDVVPALARHLGPAVLAFDEAAPIPIPQDGAADGLVRFVTHLRQVLFERDEHLAVLQEAVALRDTILDELRRDRETVLQRLRRKLRSRG
ncbi:MAG TPA: hypothetical protein VF921_09800 [Vicinamibacterales bacterium]